MQRGLGQEAVESRICVGVTAVSRRARARFSGRPFGQTA